MGTAYNRVYLASAIASAQIPRYRLGTSDTLSRYRKCVIRNR